MNKESIKRIIDDFQPDNKDKYAYDQYGHVHLCFTSNFLTDDAKQAIFKQITQQKKLVIKLKTIMECNFDFNIWQDNVFWLNTPK